MRSLSQLLFVSLWVISLDIFWGAKRPLNTSANITFLTPQVKISGTPACNVVRITNFMDHDYFSHCDLSFLGGVSSHKGQRSWLK